MNSFLMFQIVYVFSLSEVFVSLEYIFVYIFFNLYFTMYMDAFMFEINFIRLNLIFL